MQIPLDSHRVNADIVFRFFDFLNVSTIDQEHPARDDWPDITEAISRSALAR